MDRRRLLALPALLPLGACALMFVSEAKPGPGHYAGDIPLTLRNDGQVSACAVYVVEARTTHGGSFELNEPTVAALFDAGQDDPSGRRTGGRPVVGIMLERHSTCQPDGVSVLAAGDCCTLMTSRGAGLDTGGVCCSQGPGCRM
jgi:hypothetical protein